MAYWLLMSNEPWVLSGIAGFPAGIVDARRASTQKSPPDRRLFSWQGILGERL